ncbi:MAG: NAD-dependent epimerase/dehydratase family protein [Deltaproteobacteria bacterium]|nr:NAD-dependent epimerase/dehydratase family protein [Deltaproteobacteria bacterium]
MKRRVVITGVAGFIGSNLAVRLLEEGFNVIGIDNLSYGRHEQIPAGVRFLEMDIRSPKLRDVIEPDDVIFHLAAKNCISDCQENPVETSDINVTGSVSVLEAARIKKAHKVIYAETSALYEGCQKLPSNESEVSPQSFYALSKFAEMKFVEGYQRFFGVRTTGLRYFNVYGPRQDYRRTIPPVMSAFIINLLQGKRPVIYGSGQKRRDFVYVDDVNEFHLLCLQNSHTDNRTFNVGSAENYSIQEIFEQIEGILKINLEPIYKTDLPGEAQETLADIQEAKSLGWAPKIFLKEGLKRSIAYIQDLVLPQLAKEEGGLK